MVFYKLASLTGVILPGVFFGTIGRKIKDLKVVCVESLGKIYMQILFLNLSCRKIKSTS
jgi:hypothetical protein